MWLAIPAGALGYSNVFERQATCPDPSYSRCVGTNLPRNFCCPSGSSCLELAGSTTLLCCPLGTNCSSIQPINCDITQQNITLHPSNVLKTTALTVALPQCAGKCCPFGFACTGNVCQQEPDQAKVPTGTSSSSSSSSQSAPTTTSGAPSASSPNASTTGSSIAIVPTAPASTSCPSNTPSTIPSAQCNKFPVSAVLAGFFPGLALGIILTLASVCLLGARRRSASRRKSGSSFGNISDPQPAMPNDMRTDFLRKQPLTPSTAAAGSTRSRSRSSRSQQVRSLFKKSPAPTQSTFVAPSSTAMETPREPPPLNVHRHIPRTEPPVTPKLQREPSYENINIFADGDTASALRQQSTPTKGLAPPRRLDIDGRMSQQTTFTDMMESSGLAGLQKGQRMF
ncbi:hypothetical protein BJ875DRAFT_369626 [Amylocarpus encephaloides]|uniref:Uncharacterized protein n=1 Tax=Amylocarpus encephaloides TaxID=45428 RepID=A0A9P7YPU5_9HELO|nr:hypothetical protein BJ875DRAFT_369626 [Amylocarpus encephaloides]